MKKFKHLFLVIIKCILGFNMLLSLAWYSEHKEVISTLSRQDEFSKIRVLIDSINIYKEVSSTSASGMKFCEVNFSNPKGKIAFQDNENSIFKPEKEKSNIVQFLEYSKKHNDSIYIWHHPKLKDRYAEENELFVNETFNWYKMIFVVVLFYIGVFTAIFLLLKYVIKIKMLNK